CATCRDIVGLPRVPWPTHRRSRRSSCALRPCAGTSGNIAFFPPFAFPLPESVPIASVPIHGVIALFGLRCQRGYVFWVLVRIGLAAPRTDHRNPRYHGFCRLD